MEIVSDETLSTKVIDNGDDYALPKSAIYLNNNASESIIEGAVLESCVRINDFYLLFITDDIPNEDTLHIYLLNNNAVVIDSVSIGSMYATGSFELLDTIEPNTVVFSFIGSTKWKIHVFGNKVSHVPFLSDPKGVSRKLCFNTYLKIDGAPIPDSSS